MKLHITTLKTRLALGVLIVGLAAVQGQTNLGLDLQTYAGLTVTGTVGHVYEIQATTNVNDAYSWNGIAAVTLPEFPQPYLFYDLAPASRRFYRAVYRGVAPTNMVLIPAGSFTMGDQMGDRDPGGIPMHSVYVSAIFMDKYEVTKALWDQVYQAAIGKGYAFDNAGLAKANNHPVHTVSWCDAVKWCNARSELEGKIPAYYTSAAQSVVYRTGQLSLQNTWVKWNSGYRLPTEAEWEKAARGGLNGKRFPWGDTITHEQANYASDAAYPYDLSFPRGFHPNYLAGGTPYTSPVGSFAPNAYGLYDMAGNVSESCWDLYGAYSSSAQTNPRGPSSGSNRVAPGGSWGSIAWDCRTACRYSGSPTSRSSYLGFRSVLPLAQ